MAHRDRPSNRRRRPPQPAPSSGAGFSLVELMVAMGLLLTSLLMGVISGESNVITMLRNLNLSSQENLIEEDAARLRQLAEDYTWCSGRGTVGRPSGSDSCASDTPLTSGYYFPDLPLDPQRPDERPPENPEPIRRFTDACRDGSLTAALREAIEALDPPSHSGSGGGGRTLENTLRLQRSVALLDPDATGSEQSHILRVRYRYARPEDPRQAADHPPIDRDVLLLPAVAAWCP